jgi:hypothetical protein
MKAVFRAVLHLYPQWHRRLFGAEMESVFERGRQVHRASRVAYARFVAKELCGLIPGALRARLRDEPCEGLLHEGPATATNVPAEIVPEEVARPRDLVTAYLDHLKSAIARRQFERARFYSTQDLRAREGLRLARKKYGLEK